MSIEIPRKEFTLPAIAAVAKELLEEEIFESQARAKLRYPELFKPSEAQEAERAASEAKVVRIEADAAHEMESASDDEGGDTCPDIEQVQRPAVPDRVSKSKTETPDNVQISAAEAWQVSP